MLGNELSRPGRLKTSLLAHNAVLVSQNDGSSGRSVVYSEGEQPESLGYAAFNRLAQQALKLTIASKDPKAEPWRACYCADQSFARLARRGQLGRGGKSPAR